MKRRFPLLALAALALLSTKISCSPAWGQDEPSAGFLKIVNAVPGDTPTYIRLGGLRLLGGEAVPPGAVSGMLGLAPGTHEFEIANASCRPERSSGSIEIEAGKTFALIFHIEVQEGRDGEEIRRLRHAPMTSQHEHDQPKLTLVSLSREPLIQVEAARRSHLLNPLAAIEIPVELDATVAVRQNGENLGVIEIIGPLHFLGFLFDRTSGEGQELVVIQHHAVAYDPPKESFDDEDEAGTEEVPAAPAPAP